MHEAYGWSDPVLLAQNALADLRRSSHDLGIRNNRIDYDDADAPVIIRRELYSVVCVVCRRSCFTRPRLFAEPKWERFLFRHRGNRLHGACKHPG